MKTYKRISLLSFCIVLFCVSCANLGDSVTELGNGYEYRVDGSLRWIRTNNIMREGVYPNVMNHKFDDNYILVLQEPTTEGYKRLLAEDLRYRYQSAIYKANTSETDVYEENFLKSHLWTDSSIHAKVAKEMKPDNQTSFEMIDLIADSIIKFDPFIKSDFERKRNYWIIIKKKDVVLGPYSRLQYQQYRKQLKIPETLQLEE